MRGDEQDAERQPEQAPASSRIGSRPSAHTNTSLNRDSHIGRSIDEAAPSTGAGQTTTPRGARPPSRNARAASSGLFFTDRTVFGSSGISNPFPPINNRVGNAFSRSRSNHAVRDQFNPFLTVGRTRNQTDIALSGVQRSSPSRIAGTSYPRAHFTFGTGAPAP